MAHGRSADGVLASAAMRECVQETREITLVVCSLTSRPEMSWSGQNSFGKSPEPKKKQGWQLDCGVAAKLGDISALLRVVCNGGKSSVTERTETAG